VQCIRDQLEAGLPTQIDEDEAVTARQRALISAGIAALEAEIEDLERSPSRNPARLLQARAELKQRMEELNSVGKQPEEPARNAAIAASIDSNCRQNIKYRSNLWNRSAISIGAAPTFLFESGEFKDLDDNGVSLWGTIAYGFDKFSAQRSFDIDNLQPSSTSLTNNMMRHLERHGQLLLHARYRGNEEAEVNDDFVKQDLLTVGTRLRLVYDKFNFNIEGALLRADRTSDNNNDYYCVSLGAGIKIPALDGIYLSLGIGGELGRTDEDSTFVGSALKWRFGPEPTISPTR
jgi:hypothetical protein